MRKENVTLIKREIDALSITTIAFGGIFGMFGFFLFSKSTDVNSFFPLIIIVPAMLLFFYGLWMSTERLIIRNDILEKSNFFGLVKKERNLKNLKSIKRREVDLFKAPSHNPNALPRGFFIRKLNASHSTILTLIFRDEKKLSLSALLYNRKDFIYLRRLLKNYAGKNRKRFRKNDKPQ